MTQQADKFFRLAERCVAFLFGFGLTGVAIWLIIILWGKL